MFITFEGIDGCGKTTQSSLLLKYLSNLYGKDNVVITREPGGTSFNELVRKLLLGFTGERIDAVTELLFFIAMRKENFIKVIKPNLLNDKIVICDRFIDSTVAYQGYGHGIQLSIIKFLNELVVDILPDMTFIIDIDVNKSILRAHHNGYESLDVNFYKNVRYGFQCIAKENVKRCHIIQCEDDDKNSIHNKVIELFHAKQY
ncbi:dTMP kinase [Neoehrlichia mikurensis]|uniref:Thymidylate kinase n=1 Tax=Neoehrlichia mikurensis TaxID=89586 RepID=A0A9Q9F4A4_9RICK|nr:dTMP kinase [Neoehrlichia mikurensis]QXK91681.1 dTMP kinase [Neoehrlichia mikurensis]QXK92892.1 dTMP kinase [Neoehrlichia mikurensis]QXK93372.1 dTMP kinase [Neoehrlichia mikurensis]UTO55683.1 dTMP kinase [Neoehrlichia mikurensis]UTO56601.1 dTMP kinase [Neoehrlichia mikurensis]